MKFLAPALIFCGAAAFSQSPQVPHKMQFAGMTLTIRDDARREIQKDVDALTQSPKHFNIKAERAKTYFPIIEKIFAEEHLPDDFKYLSLQESALIPDAVSSSNAVGFWQFLDFTATEMGLRMDREVDERMNIVSSSRAAARYLKQCNHYFNNWLYALQAYQMGAGGVMRALQDKDLGARHMEITAETYWYVKKYLAHKVAFEGALEGKPAVEVTSLISAGGKSTQEIAQESSVDELRLKEFNKWLKVSRVPTDKDYVFIVPNGEGSPDFSVLAMASSKSGSSVKNNVSASQERISINGLIVIRAIKGEGVEALAKRGNCGLKKFLRYNDMSIDQPIEAGQLYFLEKKKKRGSDELYTLQQGDNLWSVSQRFGIQKKSLMRFNGIDRGGSVPSGNTLYLQAKNPGGLGGEDGPVALLDESEVFSWDSPKSKQQEIVKADSNLEPDEKSIAPVDNKQNETVILHEVKATDTLYSVARQYGVTIKDLMEWNGKKDFSVSVGEKLKVRPR